MLRAREAPLVKRNMERYNSFNNYLKGIFGTRVQRISVDAGLSCPNLDGKLSYGGCTYCNNKAFGRYAEKGITLHDQIEASINFYLARGVDRFIVYFQSFTNTYADLDTLRRIYDSARDFSQVVGIAISTRPDCVDEEKIKLIASYGDSYMVWIEYGLQTTSDSILRRLNRRHSYGDFLGALTLSRRYNINTAAHVILGLPGASYEDMLDDAAKLAACDLQGIKFHVLHVLKETALEEEYYRGKIDILERAAYIKIVCDFIERLPPSVVILRLVSSALGDYLVAPQWLNNKAANIKAIRDELARRDTHQGCKL